MKLLNVPIFYKGTYFRGQALSPDIHFVVKFDKFDVPYFHELATNSYKFLHIY